MTTQKRAHALVTAPFRGEGLATLESVASVVLDPWIDQFPLRIYGPDDLAARVSLEGADILICEADFCMGAVLDLPLRAIASTRGTPTNVDVDAATSRGIPVLHTPGRNADAVAEMTVALLFAASRMLISADRDLRAGEVVKDGRLSYQRFRSWQLAGRTAGIIGLGAVGRATQWRLEGLGMKVIAYDPYNSDATHSLEALLAEADVVSVHAAPTPETLGMIGAAQLALMKEGSIFINSARAALHDLDALTEALTSGHLFAAGLDHFEGERLPKGHALLALDNVVLTPHIGGATYDTEVNHSRMIADDLVRLLSGERPNFIVNPEVLEGIS
ncbi:MAG: 3-phosphoglycerate dehydrogenase [bacterium]|nr:3-phosphoglycerate dehydrogenase [Deltaproteobacteria bacterium]MCP4908316.1 3-phosphoglycerate dehydrogenase [bacterium]